jgi:hypothetical protein
MQPTGADPGGTAPYPSATTMQHTGTHPGGTLARTTPHPGRTAMPVTGGAH